MEPDKRDKPLTKVPIISMATFFWASVGSLSLGVVLGVRKVLRKEGGGLRAYRSSFPMAFRALGYGTALSLSSFTAATAFFALATGVRSFEDFRRGANESMIWMGITKELTLEEVKKREHEEAEALRDMEESWESMVSSFSATVGVGKKEAKEDEGSDEKR